MVFIKVLIALSLIAKPNLIIADEPTSALDVIVQYDILKLLKEIQKQYHMAMIFITHDVALLKYFAEHILVMYQGQIVEQGKTKEVLERPKHEYTKRLIREIIRFSRES